MANRLAGETSQYLLQHKDNPVDWYPWGDEALDRARSRDVPIFLSVGYSACHWCHVMEHESFADPATAAILNEHFVSIKVDREERPDIDAVYMQAVQQMTGQGGWPMSVFLTPDASPFFGGTYFPPEPRHNLPSFRQVLLGVVDAFQSRRGEVDRSAEGLRAALRDANSAMPAASDPDLEGLHRAFQTLAARFDSQHGGFGSAPKFPQPMILEFLLAYGSYTGSDEALRMTEGTLGAMMAGGIHDQIGGGFHRYSVDARWLVPHFEKMLYDNALLARAYVHAYQATGRADFRGVAEDLFAYVQREMRSPDGGFYSSQDADSEGEEGKFYVWTAEEIDHALGPVDGPIFRDLFGVSDGGNWEGRNILHRARPAAEVAAAAGVTEVEVGELVERARTTLYDLRAARVWPGRDEKVLTGWNAMMLHAYADASRVLDEPAYADVAAENADFLLRELRQGDTLLRSWRDGSAHIEAFLDDHALLAEALVALYGATFDPHWVREARWVADRMIDRFWSTGEERFHDTPADGQELIVRPRDIYDNATPSGTSAAAGALLRLSRLTGDPRYEEIASMVIRGLADVATQFPQAFGHLLGAVALQVSPPSEVAIVGDPGAPDTRELLDVLRGRFLPFTTLALRRPNADAEIEELLPILADRVMLDGRPTAYVCERYACRQPVTRGDELAAELSRVVPTRS